MMVLQSSWLRQEKGRTSSQSLLNPSRSRCPGQGSQSNRQGSEGPVPNKYQSVVLVEFLAERLAGGSALRIFLTHHPHFETWKKTGEVQEADQAEACLAPRWPVVRVTCFPIGYSPIALVDTALFDDGGTMADSIVLTCPPR
jgi:hypothetical protein